MSWAVDPGSTLDQVTLKTLTEEVVTWLLGQRGTATSGLPVLSSNRHIS